MEPIRRRRLYEEIAEQLERLIISGEFPAGSQLPSERDLMQQLKVGRPAVREALFALQKMGMVSLSNGERAMVIAPTASTVVNELSGAVRYFLSTPSGVRSLQDARAFLEIGLARYAAVHASAEDLQHMKDRLEENERLVENRELFPDSDVAFHLTIARIANNPIFTTLNTAFAGWLRAQRSISAKAEGSQRAACKAHRAIFDAIARRDPDAAERAMREHLEAVTDYYWQGEALR